MKKNSMKKLLSLTLCVVLIAAMALFTSACGSTASEPSASANEITYTVITVDLEGNETKFEISTDKKMVGEALLEEGIIAGEQGDYGLYVKTVNGITLDWDKDAMYWALYIDGEYALTGVDQIEAVAGATYTIAPEG